MTSDQTAEVTVKELQPTTFNYEIVGNGRLAAKEKADLSFESSSGIVDQVFVSNGQRVAKGQKIASLDMFKLQNQLEKDRGSIASARLEMQDVIIGQGYDPEHLDKVPDEVMKLALLRSGMEQAELSLAATKRDMEQSVLRAPISGVIANLEARSHSMLPSGKPVCTVINDGAMEVEFNVLESELPMVKPGDTVEVAPFAGGDNRIGKITGINPMIDDNGMVKVMAAVNGGSGLIDGMNVKVTVRRPIEKALVVPKSAVVLRSGRQVVFTLSDGKAMWNYVTTGLENLGEYTVTEGLEPGMTVITTGNVNLAHESPVKVIE